MKTRPIFIVALAAILAFSILYWHHVTAVLDKRPALERRLSAIRASAGISDKLLVKKTVKEKVLGRRKYLSGYEEYTAPAGFVWKKFEALLRENLRWSRFRVASTGHVATHNADSYVAAINLGRFDILTIRINKKKAVRLPAVEKKYKAPKVAIVIDDFGYNMNNTGALFAIKQPVTLSILPDLPYSEKVSREAKSRGYEVILHLPLEPHSKAVAEEAGTIKSGMGDARITATLEREIESVPGVDGVSNHMGSKSTEEFEVMTPVMKTLKRRGLYFFDSLTSQKSICREAAASAGVPYARRDVFLDASNDTASITKQIFEMRRLAFRRGKIIAVCHDRKATIAALAAYMPEFAEDGIEFVSLSKLVK